MVSRALQRQEGRSCLADVVRIATASACGLRPLVLRTYVVGMLPEVASYTVGGRRPDADESERMAMMSGRERRLRRM